MRTPLRAAGPIVVALSAALASKGVGQTTAQPAGSVLTFSDITSEHLIERPVRVEGRAWLGLVIENGASTLRPFDLSWTGSVLFGDSVFALQVGPPTPLLLVSGVSGVRAGPATTIIETEEALWLEGHSIELTLGATGYRLELGGSDSTLCDAVVTLSNGALDQRLYNPASQPFACDEPHFSVQWAGDLDRDGRLDLVTTFSSKYSWYPRQLWLSSAAPSGALVGLAAVLETAAAE